MNKLLKTIGYILGGLIVAGVVTYAAPNYSVYRTELPETDNTYDLGTSTRYWRNGYLNNIYSSNINATSATIGNLNITLIGTSSIIRVSTGTAAVPSFSFDTDTDTGIYSSASNVLNFTTAGTNRGSFGTDGTFSVFGTTTLATTAGRVGIGTTSPRSMFEVYTGATNNARGIVLSQGGTNSGRLYFTDGSDGDSFALLKLDTSLAFNYGATAGSGSGTTGMVMTTTGKVGIGTITPDYTLTVGSGQLANADGALATPSYSFFNDPDTGIYRENSGIFDFVSNGSKKATVYSAGITGGSGAVGNAVLSSTVGSTTIPAFFLFGDTTTGIGRAGTGILSLIAGGVNVMNITTSSGNPLVGIGTTTPASLFTVASSTGSANFFQVQSNGNIIFGNGGNIAQASSTAWTMNVPMNIGNIVTVPDLGVHTLYNQPVSASTTAGTAVGPTFSIDGTPLTTWYGESDGSGGVQNLRFTVGTSTPIARFHVVNNTVSTTVAFGSSLSGTNQSAACFWNGASFTNLTFVANSITPVYTTSTACQ